MLLFAWIVARQGLLGATHARRPTMPRMKILNTVEQEAFDLPPVFNSVQRKQFF
jgi:hypothetical protein